MPRTHLKNSSFIRLWKLSTERFVDQLVGHALNALGLAGPRAGLLEAALSGKLLADQGRAKLLLRAPLEHRDDPDRLLVQKQPRPVLRVDQAVAEVFEVERAEVVDAVLAVLLAQQLGDLLDQLGFAGDLAVLDVVGAGVLAVDVDQLVDRD